MAGCRASSWSMVMIVHVDLYGEQARISETLNDIIWPIDGAPVGVTGTLHLQLVKTCLTVCSQCQSITFAGISPVR